MAAKPVTGALLPRPAVPSAEGWGRSKLTWTSKRVLHDPHLAPLCFGPAAARTNSLADLRHYLLSLRGVHLGVDLGHRGGAVAQDQPRRLDSVLAAEQRRAAMAQLVGVPDVLGPPRRPLRAAVGPAALALR